MLTHRDYYFSDYYQVLRPRLEEIAARESEPKMVPLIALSWGANKNSGAQPARGRSRFSSATNLGLQAIEEIRAKLLADDKWLVAEESGFTWWAHRFAQRVYYQPASGAIQTLESKGETCWVGIETSFWKDVKPDSRFVRRSVAYNLVSTISAHVYDSEQERVTLRCGAVVEPQNMWRMVMLLGAAAAIQLTEVPSSPEPLWEWTRDEEVPQWDESSHPQGGWRNEPDVVSLLLEIIGVLSFGQMPSAADFATALKMPQPPWILANGNETGLTAEFLFTGSRNALFQASARKNYLGQGNGLLLQLWLPVSVEPMFQLANELNLAESRGQGNGAFFGGWSVDPKAVEEEEKLVFTSFIPDFLYTKGLLELLILDASRRAEFAASFLARHR